MISSFRDTAKTFALNHIPPLFALALIFTCGIAWHALEASLWYLAIVGGILTVILIMDIQKTYAYSIAWTIAAFSAGAFRNILHEHYYLQKTDQLCKGKIAIEGRITALEDTNNRFTSCLTIAVKKSVAFPGTTYFPNPPCIKIYCSHKLKCREGDQITLQNLYLRPPKKNAYHLFLKKQGIIATGYFGKEQPYVVKAQPPTVTSWLHTVRSNILHQTSSVLTPRTYALFSSIFLGYKTGKNNITTTMYEQFQWWGISHYLARSGLHLVILVILLHYIFMILPCYFMVKQFIIASSIGLYVLLSWPSVSFVRSVIMIFAYLACSTLKMQHHALHNIALAGLAVLSYNPSNLFALDFQLSFGLTLALILLHHASNTRRLPLKNS